MSDSHLKGTALVTGASTGIGAVYADRLAKRGYDLILVARSEARLKALAVRLTKETRRSVTPLRADLNNKTEPAKVEATLRDDPSISMLVNNASIGAVTPLLNSDVERMEEMIALNVTASRAYLCRGACIRRPGKGHDHQYRLDRGHFARNAQRSLRRPRLTSSRLAIRCSTSSPTKASASRRCCRPGRQPTFGTRPVFHTTTCRRGP